MRTRTSERTTRSSTRGIQKPARSTQKGALNVFKPVSKPVTARRRNPHRQGLPLALEQHRKQTQLDPTASGALLKIPRELFALITTFLPPEATICLSLTCKLALQYTGTEHWQHREIRNHNCHSRLHLMQCLIRDAPENLTFCNFCNTLHPPLKPPRTHRVTKLTKKCMSQWAVVDYFPQVRGEESETGYSLLHAHIHEVFEKRDAEPLSTDLLSGHYQTTKHPVLDYELSSSASWIDNRLVLQHTHLFRPKSRGTIKLSDVLALPVRLCPHNSTVTSTAEKSQYVGKNSTANTPFLTHAITSAFPPKQRTGAPKPSTFRTPAPLDQKQMDRADAGEDVVWKCRGCTTKFHVAMTKGGALEITSWHCFGADLLHANRYWEWLVRREVANLGAGKRNSEFWFPGGRSVPDFKIKGE